MRHRRWVQIDQIHKDGSIGPQDGGIAANGWQVERHTSDSGALIEDPAVTDHD